MVTNRLDVSDPSAPPSLTPTRSEQALRQLLCWQGEVDDVFQVAMNMPGLTTLQLTKMCQILDPTNTPAKFKY